MKTKVLLDLVMIAMLAKDKVTKKEEQKIFGEAWDHPNEESCRKWHEAMNKEFQEK